MPIRDLGMSELTKSYNLSADEAYVRAKRMHEMYADERNPKTLKEVGEAFGGLTRERVRQIFREHRLPIRTPRQTRVLLRQLRPHPPEQGQ